MVATKTSADGPQAVARLLAGLDHPHRAGIERLRGWILEADERVREEVKWNAPSFYIDEHFATFKLHPPTQIQLVLHTGAKAKGDSRTMRIETPMALLKWPAPDRCVLTVPSLDALEENADAIRSLLAQWIAQL